MKVSKKIKDRIMKDNSFSLQLAEVLGIQQSSLRLLVRRNSDRLTLYQCVEFYRRDGYTDVEIFESAKATSFIK